MLTLAESVPEAEFKKKFDKVEKEIVAASPTELLMKCSDKIPGICMFIWDEMVHRGKARQPYKIAPVVNSGFKGIHNFIVKEIGKEPLLDVYSASYYNEFDAVLSFADITLVQCFPNDIHIADVEFADNAKPSFRKKPEKGYRNYPGLHVFAAFIGKLNAVAKDRGVERISLMVADAALYPVFSRHGFKVSDTTMAQAAFKSAGMGFPMLRAVK